MKTISLFFGLRGNRSDLDELRFYRREKAPVPTRIRVVRVGRGREGSWENLAFLLLWLCALTTVGHCFVTVLSLNWPS